jgi:hypothetical protein
MLKKVRVENAVGMVVAHDLTRIVPGRQKGVAFRKGHIITENDIPELLQIGKAHIYIMDLGPDQIHEDEAALAIAKAVCGAHLAYSEPSEGKSSISCAADGVFKVDVDALREINKIPDTVLATIKSNTPCRKDQIVAGTRIVPLLTAREHVQRIETIAGQRAPVLTLHPYRPLKFGGVVTGSEIYEGIVDDGFDDHVAQKAVDYGCEYLRKIIVPDDDRRIADAIIDLKNAGCEMIVTTGGLSVDPDDVTVSGVRRTGAEIIRYGSPVLPGAMFLYAVLGDTPILGLPACVFYHDVTLFNLVLPRILTGEILNADAIAEMGHGGLCLNCPQCRFPACPFGR